MIWAQVMGITFIAALMALYEWPRLGRGRKKEKAAFVTLTALGWLLAVLYAFNPDMPGPTQLIDAIYGPLGKILEQ